VSQIKCPVESILNEKYIKKHSARDKEKMNILYTKNMKPSNK